jgi:hypothetical protein
MGREGSKPSPTVNELNYQTSLLVFSNDVGMHKVLENFRYGN